MEANKYTEKLKPELLDCVDVDEPAKERSASLRINYPVSVNDVQSSVDGPIKSHDNIGKKSQLDVKQNKKKIKKFKPSASFCSTAKKVTDKGLINTEERIDQKKNRKSYYNEHNTDLVHGNQVISVPSTSLDLSNEYRRETEVLENIKPGLVNTSVNDAQSNKSQDNIETKSQVGLDVKQNKRKVKQFKPSVSFCATDNEVTKIPNTEKTIAQKKKRKRSANEHNTDLAHVNQVTRSVSSTTHGLSNGYRRQTKVDKTETNSHQSNQFNLRLQPTCESINKIPLRTLFPHVGLHYFPDSNKATPIPISNERKLLKINDNHDKLAKPKNKMFSLTVDRVYRNKEMNVPADSEFLSSWDDPKSLMERKKSKNAKIENPEPSKGKPYPHAAMNFPLAKPGVMVGFTPAGQRHEVNLNVERPTRFSSEYAQVQFDDATKINVSRMLHDMESGSFVPAELDVDLERKYKEEQELFRKKTSEVLKELATNYDNDSFLNVPDLEEHYSKLDTEDKLIELVQFAMLRHIDFPLQVSEKLKLALNMKMTPLMFKKHPVLLECIQELSESCMYLEVKHQAQALLDKIKGLFNVPETQTFDDYFESQVDILKEATEHMNLLELMTMTEEPNKEHSDENSIKPIENAPSDPCPHTQPFEEDDISGSQDEDEWIPLTNNDDVRDIFREGISEELHTTVNQNLSALVGNAETSFEHSSSPYESGSSVNGEESDSEDESLQFLVMDLLNGTLFEGYPGFTKIDFFEYI